MKLSCLLKSLYNASEFTSANSLAKYTNQTHPFVSGLLSEEKKESMGKMDAVFEALTEGISTDDFMAALKLVSTVRKQLIEKEQIL